MNPSSAPAAPPSERAKYLTLLAAFLGWLFDGFEMGLFPLIGQPALKDLLGAAADPSAATKWFGAIIAVFLVGAACGGVVFGWLGDKLGRVRAMSLSIFTYAIFTGLCGFATEAWHIAALRFIASLGMGGEWSLGVALVNEVWPGKSRMLVAGLIGAALALAVIFVFINIIARKIPLRPLFLITSAFLFLMALKFIGQALQEFQEQQLISFTEIKNNGWMEVVGLNPTWEAVSAQLVVIVLAALTYLILSRRHSAATRQA